VVVRVLLVGSGSNVFFWGQDVGGHCPATCVVVIVVVVRRSSTTTAVVVASEMVFAFR